MTYDVQSILRKHIVRLVEIHERFVEDPKFGSDHSTTKRVAARVEEARAALAKEMAR